MYRADKKQNMLEAVLKYAEQRWPVLPLSGKEPLTKHGYKDGTCDEGQIRKWWSKDAHANVGIVTGDRSGLIVLDIDMKKGKDGVKSLQELEQQYGTLPKTLKAQTASGAWHYVFRLPVKGVKSIKGVREGIDLLANGSYFVAFPSKIEDNRYQWVEDGDIAVCPDWVLTLTKPKKAKPVAQQTAVNPRIPELIRELFEDGRESNGNWNTCCPYHDDSTPSFSIKLDNGTFVCHSGDKCGEKGSFVKLYAKMKNMPEDEARIMLRPIPPYIEKLNRDHAVIKIGGDVEILNEEIDPVEDCKNISFSSKADFLLDYQNRTTKIRRKRVQIAKLWLDHPARRQYRGVVFAPGAQLSKDYYNLWQGFGVIPKRGDCRLLLNHILENACRGDLTLNQYILTWMAQAVQEPANKPGIALV